METTTKTTTETAVLLTTVETLKRTLTPANKIAGNGRNTIPVLNYARIKDGRILATDLETQYSDAVPYARAVQLFKSPTSDAYLVMPIRI